jgi:signal-transduction protein with cAMP-binding, CBS, and nucleotidyltransferase domain
MTVVINQMKEYDISQILALNPDGTLAGIVTEVDLLSICWKQVVSIRRGGDYCWFRPTG